MLRTRILSALVMAPPALLAIWLGGYAFAALAALAAAIMCWEWERMVAGRFALSGRVAALACAAAALLAVSHPVPALALVLASALASGLTAKSLWLAAAPLYAGLPSAALVWLRGDPASGLETVLWLMLLVWATDIGAYAAGRLIGGPLLMPRVSPKKTWAGLAGGVVWAALVGAGAALWLGLPQPAAIVALSGFLAVIAQAGDLLESWVKRRWGVKDSSAVIPGHGGVMDRVDGLLAAGLAVALASLAGGGAVLYWQ